MRPACNDMQITFDVLQCYDLSTGLWSFSFSNFSADIGNCPAFIAWFNSLSPADQSSQIDNWEYSLSEVTEQTYIQNFFLNSPVPYMTCPKQTFNSEFSTEICTYRCLTFKSDGKPVIIRNFCGSQCCIRSIEGCINVSGFYQTLGPPTFTTKGATCPEDFELPNCPPNSILLDKKCGKVCGPH
ncbi:MAG: hypothetical protein IPO94_06305 [Saprospiraceae bacterium]|nr:hypothetical protein [Saprospiraceae bacterium]